MRILVTIIFLTGIFASCRLLPFYWLEKTNKRFDFEKHYHEDHMPDTNAVYLSKSINMNGDSTYRFFRYFGNGRAFKSRIYYNKKPTKKDYNSLSTEGPKHLSNGEKYYYDFVQDSILRAESFMTGKDGYYFFYSKVYLDSIVTFKRRIRGTCNISHFYRPGVRKRKEVELTNFDVDW